MSSNLAQFNTEQHVNLETFRKNGEGVKTPVWFVIVDGVLYVRTIATTAKVKRVRRDGHVRLAPCTARGEVRGTWVDGRARIVDDAGEAQRILQLFHRKYGIRDRFLVLVQKIRRVGSVVIAIQI